MDYLSILASYGSVYYHTHHVGNLYCGALAFESGCRCLGSVGETAKNCCLLAADTFKNYLKEKENRDDLSDKWEELADSFFSMSFGGFQTVVLAYSAFHPIAGVALPILLMGSYVLLEERTTEIHVYENCPIAGSLGKVIG